MMTLPTGCQSVFSPLIVLFLASFGVAETIPFGAGADRFEIEFVTIGDPGNAPDTRLDIEMGGVEYTYQIAKYE